MALTNVALTANQTDYLELVLSASRDNVSWAPYIANTDSSGTTYTIDTDSAIGEYIRTGGAVTWCSTSPGTQTDVIRVTALQDSFLVYLCAASNGVTKSGYAIAPYQLTLSGTQITQTSASLSCFYVQVSTGVTMGLPPHLNVQWTVSPAICYIREGFTGDENIYWVTQYPTLTGTSPSAANIKYSYAGSDIDQVVVITGNNNDKYRATSNSIVLTDATYENTFNPGVKIFVESESTDNTVLSAIKNNIPVETGTNLRWNVEDTTNLRGLTGSNLDSNYTFNNVGDATQLNRIKLSAIDLSRIYTYSLSSFSGTVSGEFRPYRETSDAMIVSARITQSANDDNVFVYNVHGFGSTNGQLHNFAEAQYIVWQNSDSNIAANKNNNTSYTFNTEDVAVNIDDLTVRITPPTVTTTPRLCTTSLMLCALSTSNVIDGIIDTYEATIQYYEWLDTDYFDPRFRFQYESENATTIYRPVTSTANYTISNTSILPENSVGYIVFTINQLVCTLPYDITNEQTPPSGIVHPFESSTPCVCTISMMVCASATNFDGYFTRSADPKNIVFANVPVASGFIIYPEFAWNGSAWTQIVDSYVNNRGTILDSSAPLSAYGLCHTENFFVSSNVSNGTSYVWYVKNIDGTGATTSTTVSNPTGWVSLKTPASTVYMAVCSTIFTAMLSSNMPNAYYDTASGTPFTNFSSTFGPATADHRKHIYLVGGDNVGITPTLSSISYIQHPAPNNMSLLGKYTIPESDSLFTAYIPAYYFRLSSIYWNEIEYASSISSQRASKTVYINVDDIGDSYLGVPLNEHTCIKITPGIEYTLQLKAYHPSANDWCLENNSIENSSGAAIATAFPMTPVGYTTNRYVVTGESVTIQNLVQCFSGVSGFKWEDRSNTTDLISTCVGYTTSFDTDGGYGIALTNIYYTGTAANIVTNTFTDAIQVLPYYLEYDPDISRIYQFTTLELPYNENECSMPPNEWLVKDTFNSCIQKLYDNLTYLQNMSQLYDTPPTEYIGWYGSLHYNNSAARTRWFTNIVHNNYAYDHPEYAISHAFTDLQSVAVKNNKMYVSDGTTVYILSSDIFGHQIASRNYKTIGDDFSNVRTIRIDSTNRIYLLDSWSKSNPSIGSKNRVLVYSYNDITSQWTLLYEWGGLGGLGAKNKFNKPSDLHIDSSDNLWVADTGNKCIKKYTRTGSWLATITSDYFTDTEKPNSVSTDDNDNVYVLTNTQIVKFNSDLEFVLAKTIPEGGLKINKCQDGGFIYVVYANSVIKFNTDCDTSGNIAANDFVNYTEDFRDVFHDEHRNLYIVNTNHILKYVDKLTIISLKIENDIEWTIDQLKVHKDEYIQDWVVNRCFQRLWDNIELFRRSLLGKFGYQTITNTTETTFVSTRTAPDDFNYCEYDWLYNYGVTVTRDVEFQYQKPVVRTFTANEFKSLPHNKSDLIIGLNELNTADVYNRIIKKLYDCQNTLLQMIKD